MAQTTSYYDNYVFTPNTSTLVINQYIPQERLVSIVNTTRGVTLFKIGDPTFNLANFTASVSNILTTNNLPTSSAKGTTTIVFGTNTNSMSPADKLTITVDEYAQRTVPVEELYDPVGKQRVSTPQSMIDTDFEYGNQTSKWEALGTTNWHPAGYNLYPPISLPTTSTTVTGISLAPGSKVVTVALSGTNPYSIGQPISIQDTWFTPANGNFIVESVSGQNITYSAKAVNNLSALTNIFDPFKTQVWQQSYYTGAPVSNIGTMTASGTVVYVNATINHGLAVGNEIAVSGTAAPAANGNFFVTGVTSVSGFSYAVASGALTNGAITVNSASFVPRNQSLFAQRPFDGGVLFGTQSLSNNQSAIRQTRRNFHYQSGKGLEMATGTILKTAFTVDNLSATATAIGSVITVQTREQHNLTPGVSVNIAGVITPGYNGTYNVASIIDATHFTIIATNVLGNTNPSDYPASFICTVNNWYGASQRMGLFNQENGMFFEYDGQQLYAVLRSSIKQIAGRVTVTNGSTTITATDTNYPTLFSKQLAPGQNLVIRGLSYRVTDIVSDTTINISPAYRGITANYVTVTATVDNRIPQSLWNIDKLDGTGPSGYNLDLTKMQMWLLDYSWYGAGFVRWGLRTTDGNILFCHKLANNNVNTTAYMRSGNLPGRYETVTTPPIATLASGVNNGFGATDTTLYVNSTLNPAGNFAFPASGTLAIRLPASGIEYVNYNGITASGFTITTRGVQTLSASGTYLPLTLTSGNVTGYTAGGSTVSSGVQVGMRVTLTSGFPDNTYVSSIAGSGITFSSAYMGAANPTVVFQQLGIATNISGSAGPAYTYSPTAPIAVELAMPTHSPYFSHWGTAVTMDGGFSPDQNLLFTYGQTTPIALASGQTRALMSIRIAPSVDNSQISSILGSHELSNRVQLQLQTLDVSVTVTTSGAQVGSGNVLIKAYLNSTPQLINGGTLPSWVNTVSNANNPNSSLSQIVDYSSVQNGVTVASGLFAGEVTGGFFVDTTQEVNVAGIRDLGNSILNGGTVTVAATATPDKNIYPDGPDTLTLVAQNVNGVPVNLLGRISWIEPQA